MPNGFRVRVCVGYVCVHVCECLRVLYVHMVLECARARVSLVFLSLVCLSSAIPDLADFVIYLFFFPPI